MKGLARALAFLSLGLGGLLLFRVNSPTAQPLTIPKMLAASLAPYLALSGALGAVLGLLARSPLAFLAGTLGSVLAARYVRRVAAPHDGFDRAFGPAWQDGIEPEQAERLPVRRWGWRLPDSPEPRWERDVPFWTLPGSDRRLACDLWHPTGVKSSGLVVIYLHGGGWHYMDKDFMTRPLFRHLAGQGHLVMDVAYRLCPETDLCGMVGDVKRAVAWMKGNAGRLGASPGRIVLMGGSAGGHLALLAAYAPDHPGLTPEDLRGIDTSVRAVASYYGPADMRAYDEHAGATLGNRETVKAPSETGLAGRVMGAMMKALDMEMAPRTHPEMMRNLLGGRPEEVPERYDLASPVHHVGAHCPPTLLFQGEHDSLVPVGATRALHRKLVQAGVPTVYVEFPQTEHAFDILLPRYSPATRAALYDLDRFLALTVASGDGVGR